MEKALTHAMILAAGYGSRLKPLTDTMPKALINFEGKPMIENVISRLINEGIKYITVNTHYFAGQIENYFKEHHFTAAINISHEENILGTGGGIKYAEKFLSGCGDFIVHNADVVSDIDIEQLWNFHTENNSLATLAVKKRKTSRPLLIDANYNLCGRIVNNAEEVSISGKELNKTAFSGVYILSDRIFKLFPDAQKFDIISFLIDIVKLGEKVKCFDIKDSMWKDIGRLNDLQS